MKAKIIVPFAIGITPLVVWAIHTAVTTGDYLKLTVVGIAVAVYAVVCIFVISHRTARGKKDGSDEQGTLHNN